MEKRVTIFSPEEKDREEIYSVVKSYFKKEFGDYVNTFTIQKYPALHKPDQKDQLGHQYEIFTVFDRRLCPKKDRSKFMKNTLYMKTLKHSLDLTKKVCDGNNIPYIIYVGEITKRDEQKLVNKIDNLKDKIKKRLEEKLIPAH
jgi:hypothetical protein